MIDCFDGIVVSWSMGTQPNTELVNTMLDAAIEKVAASGGRPVVHSDRGGHYRWPGWLARIADAKLVCSMSRKGCSPDNAACEGFFGRLKTEMFHARSWLSTSIEEFIAALDTYIRWYNERRIKSSLSFRRTAQQHRPLGIRRITSPSFRPQPLHIKKAKASTSLRGSPKTRSWPTPPGANAVFGK
jgi:transposase InsO family protein